MKKTNTIISDWLDKNGNPEMDEQVKKQIENINLYETFKKNKRLLKFFNLKTLYLIRGLPGSGKSTFALELVPDFLVCEADKYFVVDGEYKFDSTKLKEAHNWCQKIVETYMENGDMYPKIAVSNTFTREWEMEPYFNLAEKYGYRVFSVIVENYHGNYSKHKVSYDTLNKMSNRFEINL